MTALRPFEVNDLPAAQALSAGMRWPHRMEDWALLYSLGQGIVAEDEEGVVGTGMWWAHGDHHATIGMVLVSPGRQGRGIGREIMAALLQAAAPRALMLNATAAGLKLYEGLGFVPVGDIHQYQGMWTGRQPAPPGIRPVNFAKDAMALLRLDTAAVGAPRLASLTALAATGTLKILRDRSGFAAARRFGRGTVIGPVVAADAADAIALVTTLAKPGGFVRLDIPAEAGELQDYVAAHGLKRVDTVTAMTRGAWAAKPPPRRFALIAQALG